MLFQIFFVFFSLVVFLLFFNVIYEMWHAIHFNKFVKRSTLQICQISMFMNKQLINVGNNNNSTNTIITNVAKKKKKKNIINIRVWWFFCFFFFWYITTIAARLDDLSPFWRFYATKNSYWPYDDLYSYSEDFFKLQIYIIFFTFVH